MDGREGVRASQGSVRGLKKGHGDHDPRESVRLAEEGKYMGHQRRVNKDQKEMCVSQNAVSLCRNYFISHDSPE